MNDQLKKIFPPKFAERTEIHRISSYDFRTDAHFVVIFKNTKKLYFRRPSVTSSVIRWENYTVMTIRLTDFKYD